jgi:zinc/manganese transport system substrate-binding protein
MIGSTMRWHLLLLVPLAALGLAACGDSSDPASDRPQIAVTTNILGDVVEHLLGDAADVVTIMPVGADPHDFQPSARQANEMREADMLITNGAGFEEGLLEVVEGAVADGVPVHAAISAIDPLDLEDAEGGIDPHFFTDPARMAEAAEGILDALLAEVPALDTAAVRAHAGSYVEGIRSVDHDVEALLDGVPEERRILVTNHEVFGYFADRYGFEVVGTVIPAGSTTEGASAGRLADLIEQIRRAQVPAIFADTSAPAGLARTLAEDVGDVEVVELFSESLGGADSEGRTYLEMVRTNAERIADALS